MVTEAVETLQEAILQSQGQMLGAGQLSLLQLGNVQVCNGLVGREFSILNITGLKKAWKPSCPEGKCSPWRLTRSQLWFAEVSPALPSISPLSFCFESGS